MSSLKNLSTVSESCAGASAVYYEYLKRNGNGKSEIVVTGIRAVDSEKLVWRLELAMRLYDQDSVVIRHLPTGTNFTLGMFNIQDNDENARVLIVKFLEPIHQFNDVKASDVIIVNDLLFLVKNVENWYTKNGAYIGLPIDIDRAQWELGDVHLLDTPSHEQAEAIAMAIMTPLSYVWGPPGTGKTRLVLTHAVLSLAQLEGMQIGVFAPTHIALEQAMDAILKGAMQLGMDKNKFLRLGVPSRKFAIEHPEVCEIEGLNKRITEAGKQVKIYQELYDDIESYRLGINVLLVYPKLDTELMLLSEEEKNKKLTLSKVAELHERWRNSLIVSQNVTSISDRLPVDHLPNIIQWQKILRELRLEILLKNVTEQYYAREAILERIGQLERKIKALDSEIESVMYKIRVFLNGDASERVTERTRQVTLMTVEKSVLENLENRIRVDVKHLQDQAQNETESIATKLQLEEEKRKQHDNVIRDHFAKLQSIVPESEKIARIIELIPQLGVEYVRIKLAEILEKTRQWIDQREPKYSPYQHETKAEIALRLVTEKNELDRLKKSSIEERMARCSVVGMTLDRYIGRFQKDCPIFRHIFLDEAGYAPLIKALTLFRCGCPVTFLGDHKQLPPIVEIDDDEEMLEANEICASHLWGAPAIYAETAFHDGWSAATWFNTLKNIKNDDPPSYAFTQQSNLSQSRRFGPNLCQVLDELFYSYGFESAHLEDLKIELVNVSTSPNHNSGRESQEEVNAIVAYLSSTNEQDVAVITPYKKQIKLLNAKLRKMQREDRVLTIHKSQGREWDTVIISVVDGPRSGARPWFTDSKIVKSQGAKVMNTAVSRARKRLLLVCDANYWRNRKDAEAQLISRLISLAE